jgi:hypothetical protein
VKAYCTARPNYFNELKHKMKKILSIIAMCSLFFLVYLLSSCSKKSNSIEPSDDHLTERTIQYKVDSPTVKPGMLVSLTADKSSGITSIVITLGGKQVSVVKTDSLQYAFTMPVVPPGNYTLDLAELKASSNPSIIMANYTVIKEPANIIAQTIAHYNKTADSLITAGSASPSEGAYIHQLTNQLSAYMNNASSEERTLMAYQAQSVLEQSKISIAKLQNAPTTFSNPGYKMATVKRNSVYATSTFFQNHKTSIVNTGPIDWISLSLDNSTEFTDKSEKAAHASVGAKLAIDGALKCFLTAGVLAGLPQVPPIPQMTIGAAGGGVTLLLSGVVLKIYAKKLNNEIAKEQFVAENIENSEPGTPVIFSKSKEVIQKFTGGFRNIIKSDKNTSNNKIEAYVQNNDDLASTDIKVKTKIDEIKAKFGSLLSSITGTYDAYLSPVLISAQAKAKRLIPKYVTISNVSNPDIDIQVGEDAYQQLLLSASNHKKNINSKVPLTYTVSYTQPATSKKVSITQQATYDGDILAGKWKCLKQERAYDGEATFYNNVFVQFASDGIALSSFDGIDWFHSIPDLTYTHTENTVNFNRASLWQRQSWTIETLNENSLVVIISDPFVNPDDGITRFGKVYYSKIN